LGGKPPDRRQADDQVRRALVVWCPDWPVVAAGANPRSLAAVIAAGRVVACTPAAREAGIRRGMKLRDAQRRCADLDVRADDPDAQGRAFERVIAVVEELCPRVEVIRPGLIAVPARGPSRYYGGEQEAATTINRAVAGAGFEAAVGIADGTFAATLAARVLPAGAVIPTEETTAFLAPQPVSVLNRPDLTGTLTRLGIKTLGDLAAMPARDVASRFGPDGEVAHRLATGRDARPPATRRPVEDLSVMCEFDPPRDAEPVVFAAKTLADELHEGLNSRGLACVRVEVEITLSDGRTRNRLWRHDGMLSSQAVAERVRWQLDPMIMKTNRVHSQESVHDHGDGRGVARLRLAPDQIVTDGGRQLELWGAGDVSGTVDRAASRIQVMLGHAGVTRPVLSGGRGPGERVVRVPWGDHRTPDVPADLPWPGQLPEPAPAVVPEQPRSAEVLDDADRPVSVSGRCVVSAAPATVVLDGEELAVTGWAGPWPVRDRWWDLAQAQRVVRLQVAASDGRALLLKLDRGRWSVEGIYD
jgi:protein ImuB